MSLLVDGGGYRSAAHALRDGNHGLARAYDRFTSDLRSSGAMAGSDSAGASFAEAYDEAATCGVWAQLHLVAAFGSLASLTAVSAWNHESAERRSALVPGGSPYDGGTMPADSSVTVFPREPPSALGGDGDGPGWWDVLADHVGGVLYPDADLRRLRDTGSAWTAQGQMIERFAAQCETASNLLAVQRSPEIGDALAAYDGLSVETRAVASICLTLGEVCLGFADDVEQVRHDLEQLGKELLLWTAGTQAVTHGLALFSFGAAELPGQALQAARIAATAARAKSLLSAFAAAVALRLGPLATVTRTATRSSTVLVKYASARAVLVRPSTLRSRGRRITASELPKAQGINLRRYVKKLPAGAGPISIQQLRGGSVSFAARVPGRVPGSSAVYRKVVDAKGTTTSYTKSTYSPDGSLIHRKDKMVR